MRKIFTLLPVLLLLFSGPSWAAAIDAKGAAQLKKAVEKELQWQSSLVRLGGQGITADGAVTVTPEQGFYKVIIPGVSFFLAPDRRLNIGTIAVNATPSGPGAWLGKAAVPATMSIYDKDNKPLAEISLGGQSLTATWIPDKGLYPQVNALCQDIRIRNLGGDDFLTTVATFQMISALHDNGDGTWSGPGGFDVTGIRMESSGSDAALITIGKVDVTSDYGRINLDRIAANRKKVLAMAATGKALPPEEISSMLSNARQALEGVTSSFIMSDILFQEKNVAEPRAPAEARIGNVSFRGSVQDAAQEKATADFNLFFSGLSLSAIPPAYAALVPQSGNIEAKISPLPLKKISEMAFDAVQNNAGRAVDSTITSLPQLLQAAKTTLSLRNSFFRSPDIELDITGRADADAAAVSGMTAKATLSAKGLEGAIKKLRALAEEPGADPLMGSYAGGLTAALLMGKTGPDGKSSDYHFELTSEGRFLMNDVNMMTLMTAGSVLNERVSNPQPLIPAK